MSVFSGEEHTKLLKRPLAAFLWIVVRSCLLDGNVSEVNKRVVNGVKRETGIMTVIIYISVIFYLTRKAGA